LLACPRPFDPALKNEPDEPGEPARYGSSFHAVVAACLKTGGSGKKAALETTPAYARAVDEAAKQYDVRSARDELAGHAKSSVKVLRNWLEREKLKVAEIEAAYVVHPHMNGTWLAKAIPPHDEDHRYAIEVGQIAGTVDLIALSSNRARAIVIDHKTGSGDADHFAQPASIPQMRTLGLVADAASEIEVGIFHADRRGLPIMYAEPYERLAQRAHAIELHEALARVGTGFLRPGVQCRYCPARVTCPAHAADLLAERTAALVRSANTFAAEPVSPTALYTRLAVAPPDALSAEARAGVLYDLLKKFRVLEKAGSEAIRRLVRSGAVVETRDGGTLALQEQSYETISKKSIVEALGKIAGEKELARLRKKGAMRETKREMLVPEK